MSNRPRLIFRIDDHPNFNQGWIRPLVEQRFEMIEWQPDIVYQDDDIVLATFQQDFVPDAWFRPMERQGHRVIIDHLYDSDVDTPSLRLAPHKLELRSGNWMWYRTALLAAHFGYDQYRPSRAYTHDFLCLMNKIRDHRDRVMRDLGGELTHARWSYVDRGREIGDANERATPVFWEYYMNPQWYDSTCWHLVVESWMRGDAWFRNQTHPNYKTEISEKSYKPLAYFQPFIIIGSVGTLAFLRRQGFETFDHLWSEQYDVIQSDHARLEAVLMQVKEVVKTYNRYSPAWDRVTEKKLQHNHERFFDLDLVRQKFDDEIMGDLQEFVHA